MLIGEEPVTRRTRGGSERSSASALRRHLPILLLGCLLVLGFALRMQTLLALPLWVDEAESGLNALSILQHGYPTDSYLGLPMFENILIKPWPANPEYEFRDISYTDRGIAAYHAWLPLYSIAGSLRLFGINPDSVPHSRPAYDGEERVRRTLAVRLPSVLFGTMAILGLYFAGTRFADRSVGLIAATFGTCLSVPIWFSQQAKYYAATMAAMSLCTWMAGRLLKRGAMADAVWGGISVAVLFYCHTLCFAVAGCMLALCIAIRWHRHLVRMLGRLVVLGAIPAVLCLPWMLATGFLQQTANVPKAIRMVEHPQDLFLGRVLLNEYALFALLPVFVVLLSRTRLLDRHSGLLQSVHQWRSSLLVLFAWVIACYGAFIFVMPIASFFRDRIKLMCLIPALLLVALTCRILISYFKPRHRLIAGVTLVAGFILLSNSIRRLPFAECDWRSLSTLIAYLQKTDFPPDTRVYASPNEQLVLTFYTGMPVQSIAPVRKSWLDRYPGHLMFIERMSEVETDEFTPDSLQVAAARAGLRISHDDAWKSYCDVLSRDARIEERQHVKQVWPPIAGLPPYASELLARYQYETEKKRQYWSRTDQSSNPIFKHRPMATVRDWWTAFFYGLLDYDRRRAHPNWEDRFRNATAESLRCAGWTVYRS